MLNEFDCNDLRVTVHHKFIVIDAEGANPIVYTGSANMSRNSEQYIGAEARRASGSCRWHASRCRSAFQ